MTRMSGGEMVYGGCDTMFNSFGHGPKPGGTGCPSGTGIPSLPTTNPGPLGGKNVLGGVRPMGPGAAAGVIPSGCLYCTCTGCDNGSFADCAWPLIGGLTPGGY